LRCQELLAASGFPQYEVSAYAPPGRRCRHNLNYWQFGDYLGLGAGAHGKLTDPSRGVLRTERIRQPRQYLESSVNARPPDVRVVETAELPFEYMLNALRLVEGFATDEFERRTGLSIDAIRDVIESGVEEKLLEPNLTSGWRASARGLQFLNDLTAMFLPPPPRRGARGAPTQAANLL
jgi:oxygen-independent coproporphyrinogen-3 oxidase